ncbi:MAG: NAD(P)-binding domain-containing protein [Hyphomicrobiaceae bacterium]
MATARSESPLVGILGVGHLINHLLPGLLRTDPAMRPSVLLGPRNAERAEALSRRFGCPVAADAADLVARSDVLLLAVRPFQVAEATAGLPFRADQTVVSLVAGTPIAAIAAAVRPARVLRAMPVTAAEFGVSPTCLFPADPAIEALLAPAGPVIRLAAEAEFEAASVIACYYGWVQALIGETTGWLCRQGLGEESARRLAAEMTAAAARTVVERRDEPIDGLVAELCLPGSYTGQGLQILGKADAFGPWRTAAEALLMRMKRGG